MKPKPYCPDPNCAFPINCRQDHKGATMPQTDPLKHPLVGTKNAGYRIVRVERSLGGDLYALARTSDPYGTEWVTWRVYGAKDFAHGHYLHSSEEGLADLLARAGKAPPPLSPWW